METTTAACPTCRAPFTRVEYDPPSLDLSDSLRPVPFETHCTVTVACSQGHYWQPSTAVLRTNRVTEYGGLRAVSAPVAT